MNTIGNLRLHCLNRQQHEGTCGYWYTITSGGGPFTAFRTRAALEFFLGLHELTLEGTLPDETGTHASLRLDGKCRFVSHGDMSDMPSGGQPVLKLDNGRYTKGIVTHDEDGPLVHYINVNSERPEYDHGMARAHEDAGHQGPLTLILQS